MHSATTRIARGRIDLAGAHQEPCLVMLDENGQPRFGAMISDRTGEGVAGTMSDTNPAATGGKS